jgi:release factor glutamine methyltransferase
LRAAVLAARHTLERAGIDPNEAALDAQLLARDLLGWDRATWIARQEEAAPVTFPAPFAELIARREKREPVAYIRGRHEFYGREFAVSPSALIPRPETEALIEEALLLLPALGFSRSLTVIDIGTGTGCLVVTLALEYPNARYIATDTSESALALAQSNAAQHGVADRIEFVRGSYFADARGPFNVIVSNPPYVAELDRPSLAPEVIHYEPGDALFAGADGLRDIREIVRQSSALLHDDGTLVMEMGMGQRDSVAAIASATRDLVLVRTRADLQGIPRVAVIRRCA